MSKGKGYILLHRKIQDNAFWAENRVFSKAEAWIDILMEAQWSEKIKPHSFGMRIITTGRGQSIKSLDTWAKRWKWSRSKVRRFMVLLQELSMIRYENETQTVRLTVLKYDDYNPRRNADETQMESKWNADETQMDTDNTLKKRKERELSICADQQPSLFDDLPPPQEPPTTTTKRFKAPTIEEIAEYCKGRGNGIDAQHFHDYYQARGWMVGKSKMKDWKAAIRTWERNYTQQQNAPAINTDYIPRGM